MYIHIHAYIYVCTYTYIEREVHIYINIYIYTCICVYVWSMYIYIHIHIYICMQRSPMVHLNVVSFLEERPPEAVGGSSSLRRRSSVSQMKKMITCLCLMWAIWYLGPGPYGSAVRVLYFLLFYWKLGPEPSILGPDPSQTLNYGPQLRVVKFSAPGVRQVSRSKILVQSFVFATQNHGFVSQEGPAPSPPAIQNHGFSVM